MMAREVRAGRAYKRMHRLAGESGGARTLVDRYEPEDVFARVPELADQMDPVLVQLDRLLDDDQLHGQVRGDLARRSRLTPVHGRHSTPAEVVTNHCIIHWYLVIPDAQDSR